MSSLPRLPRLNTFSGFDLVTIGRISVDLYGEEINHGLADSQTFQKAVGGSPTNVAIGTARYGHRTAVITGVGDDALGLFLLSELRRFKVSTEFIFKSSTSQTPVVIAGIKDPDNPELMFYRDKFAPDTQITLDDDLLNAVREAKIFWFTGSTLSTLPLSDTVLSLLQATPRKVIFDLDYRPSFWESREVATAKISAAVKYASIVIGNLEECAVATGMPNTSSAHVLAQALLAMGPELAIVKSGASGVLVAHGKSQTVIPGLRIKTYCGLGAGDGFGAAIAHGILSNWTPEESTRFANAAGALVASQLLCSDAMPTEAEVRELLEASK